MIDVAVAPGARLVITTAAAEKIYRSLEPDAIMDVNLKVAAGGSLAWLPQETILFDRARLVRTIDIDLAEDARLLFAEAIVFGRAGMGESVQQGRCHDRWRSIAADGSSMPKPCGSTATSPQAFAARGCQRRASPWQPC